MPQLQTIPCDRVSNDSRMFVGETVPKEQGLSPDQSRQFTQVRSEAVPVRLLPPQKSRKRGVVLTEQGWQKLLQAGVICNEFGERYTFDYFSEQTLLDARTVCRIIGREVAVDKRSLKIFFNAFNLELDQEDYTTPNQRKRKTGSSKEDIGFAVMPLPLALVPTSSPPEVDTALLKQQIIETCRRFIEMHNLGTVDCITLTLSIKLIPQASPQLELSL